MDQSKPSMRINSGCLIVVIGLSIIWGAIILAGVLAWKSYCSPPSKSITKDGVALRLPAP